MYTCFARILLLIMLIACGVATQGSVALGAIRWGETVLRQQPQWYRSAEARAVADSVIQYQSPQGGWPKSTNLATPPRTPDDIPPLGRGRANSLDNEATTLPMAFLARVAHATGEAKYRDSFLRGVDYLLAAQYPNGGWPQFWPLRDGYYSRITYNDGAMIRAMKILRDVAAGQPPYDFVDAPRRGRAADAVARGIDCILKTQIKQDGKLTAWCAQHDEKTLNPAWARAYEPPSLSGAESVGIVRFLMSIDEPTPEIVAAIEGAVAWFRSVAMKGVRLESIRREDGRTERRLVPDPDAPPLWARFYELGTNRPLYLDRDSVFRYDFSEISYERRSGYRYHGTWAASLLATEYPAWRQKHLSSSVTAADAPAVPAFPSAEGYGKYAVGGRGGKVYKITTLNPIGAGSLGAAISASGPRTVVFRVSGTIEGNFNIRNDKITIAGQTAPGDGICIKGSLKVSANDVIIRYIRVRANHVVGEVDAIDGEYHNNIILDHVSASWSSDEVLSLYRNENVTIQWCMITEACAKFVNGKNTGHRFGGIWGNNYGTYHHNLFAHNDSRNPRWASGCKCNDYRNNVLYNWGYQGCYGGEAQQAGRPEWNFTTINMVANYYKPGPATKSGVKDRIAEPSSGGSWFVADNVVVDSPEVSEDNWKGIDGNGYIKLNRPWPAMSINQETPEEAYKTVLEHAGCSFPNRDAIDKRIIEEVRNGTAKYGNNGIITAPSDIGGWPELKSTPAPVDRDHDGIPDEWETTHGLEPSNKEDGKKTNLSADSYTNLEMYLNELAGDFVKSAK